MNNTIKAVFCLSLLAVTSVFAVGEDTLGLIPNSLTPVTKEAYEAHNQRVNQQKNLVEQKQRELDQKRAELNERNADVQSLASSMKATHGDHAQVERLHQACAQCHKELVAQVEHLHQLMSSYNK